jgi:hypothetical protein
MQDFSEQIADGGNFEYPFKDRIDARRVSLFRMIPIKLWALALHAPYLFCGAFLPVRSLGLKNENCRQVVRQDKATFRSHLAALASVCLHIVFFTLHLHSSGTLQGT